MTTPQSESQSQTSILVWDVPTRVFHWLLVLSFAGAYLTAESERWRLVHVTLGYTMGGLLAFRLLWGVVGTRYARFGNFVRGPAAVLTYLRSLLQGRPEHHTGHNPAGALAIVVLLVLGAVTVLTGWADYSEIGGDWLEELHEGAANIMLTVVGLHVAAVLVSGWLHHENLVRAMITGRKQGASAEGIRQPWRVLGLLLLLGVFAFWVLQWRDAPSQAAGAGAQYGAPERDDD